MTEGKFDSKLKRFIEDSIDAEVNTEKTRQYLKLQKCDLYCRGLQYTAPRMTSDGDITFDATGNPSPHEEDRGQYEYNLDVIRTYRRKWAAILGQRPFYALKGVADDPQSEEDQAAARQAELGKVWLHSKWDTETTNTAIADNLYTAGTAWIYTPYVVDEALFGTNEEEIVESREVEVDPGGYQCIQCGYKFPEPVDNDFGFPGCPACGADVAEESRIPPVTVEVPEVTGYQEYVNGGVAFHICNALTVTDPFYGKAVKHLPYHVYEYEEDKGVLLGLYPKLRKWMDDDGNLRIGDEETSLTGEQARQSVESPSGSSDPTASQNRWTYARYWIHPDRFNIIKDKEFREHLQKNFERGLKVPVIEGHPLLDDYGEEEAVYDVWTAIKPEANDYLTCDPVCWGILGHQDIINDMGGMAIETLERGLPTHIVDAGLLDLDAISKKPFSPQEIVETKGMNGGALESRITTLPTAKFPPQLVLIMEWVEKSIQNQTGLTTRAFGGESGKMTAKQSTIDLNQALTQLGTPGLMISRGWEQATENAIGQMKKYSSKGMTVSVPGEGAAEVMDFDVLRGGSFHFESHPGFPQSYQEKREIFNMMVQQNSPLLGPLGYTSPRAISVTRDMVGIYDIKSPIEETKDKIDERIQELLKGVPTQEDVDGEIMMLPSIPPEQYMDDPTVVIALMREWGNSENGRKAAKETSDGYENVKAHIAAQQRNVAPMPMEPPQGSSPPKKPPQEQPTPGAQTDSVMPPEQSTVMSE